VTYYSIAGSLLQYLARLIGHATQVLHPYASAQEARGDTAGLRRTVVLGTKACVLIALPVTVTLMLVAEPFIRFWMGATYAAVAAPLLMVMAVGRFFWLAQSSTGNVLLGVERHQLLTTTNLITGIGGIALGAALIRPMGLLGLALGITLPMVVTQAIVLPRMVVRMFDIPASEYWRDAFILPLTACAPYVIVLYGLMRLVVPESLLQLGGVVAAATPAWVLPTAFICFSDRERRAAWNGSASLVAGVKRVFA
jgi:O-antigen/teichoic acid export membrane protein